MGVIIPTGYAQVQLNYGSSTFDSGHAQNSFGLQLVDPVDLQTLAESIGEAWTETLLLVTHEAIALSNVVILTDTERYEAGVYQAGNRTGDLAPPQVTTLVKLTTALRGRANQGRMYLPGLLNDGDIYDDGTINPTWVTDLATSFGTFNSMWASEATQTVILHSTALAPTPVNNAIIESKIATQRRRLR